MKEKTRQNEETKKIKTTVERAVEILKEEPSLKYYEAIEKAKSETYEVE